MAGPKLTVDQALTLLAETPRRIAELTEGAAETALHEPPAPGEWSATEILAHVRACADVRGAALLRILDEDRPTIRAVNPRTYVTTTNYTELDFVPSFRAFAAQRNDLLRALDGLPPEAWSRSARIVGAGKALEWSVLYYAEWLGVHERPHLEQLAATIAAVTRGRGS